MFVNWWLYSIQLNPAGEVFSWHGDRNEHIFLGVIGETFSVPNDYFLHPFGVKLNWRQSEILPCLLIY